MAKKAYIGVDGVARKVKKGYIGVNDKARKIKKAYVGIGGVARPCWNEGKLTYYGTVTGLSTVSGYLAGGAIGNYALFAGGTNTSFGRGAMSVVSVYNKSLVRSSAAALSAGQRQFSGLNCGDHLLLGGGNRDKSITVVDIYDANLTKTSLSDGLTQGKDATYTSHNAKYGLLCGGYTTGASQASVDAFDKDLTHLKPAGLSVAVYEGRGACVGDYALFGGGERYASGTYTQHNQMDAYDLNLTKTVATPLQTAEMYLGAVSVGEYALYAYNATANAYDKNLTRTTAQRLSVSRRAFSGPVNFNEAAMFVGGWDSNKAGLSNVDVYDKNLTRTTAASISVARGSGAGVVLGDYALFAGGSDLTANIYYNTVDAFTVI